MYHVMLYKWWLGLRLRCDKSQDTVTPHQIDANPLNLFYNMTKYSGQNYDVSLLSRPSQGSLKRRD